MDTSVHKPPCYTLFDPITPECASCGIQAECMREQEQRLCKPNSVKSQRNNKPAETQNHESKPIRKEKQKTPNQISPGDAQYIPEHTRKPLEIPPVGSKIQTVYKGQTFEAVIVVDPSNKRMEGRSILFNGTVYRTLTAAAHAISPGINSGSVWQEA